MTNHANSNQNRAGEAILVADEIDFRIKIVQGPSTFYDKRVNLSRKPITNKSAPNTGFQETI